MNGALDPEAFVFWFFVVAWVVVVGILVLGVVPRIVREGMRIVKRVLAFADQSPLPLQIAKAEGDAERIAAALERVPELGRRAQAAVEAIRTTPIVPPALITFARRVAREVVEFRRALS